MAGWVTSVALRSSSVPPNMMSVRRMPRSSLALSIRSLARGLLSYSSFPIPGNWDPCPGNIYASVMNAVQIIEPVLYKHTNISILFYFCKLRRTYPHCRYGGYVRFGLYLHVSPRAGVGVRTLLEKICFENQIYSLSLQSI